LVLEYVGLAPGLAREVLEIYEAWEGKEALPWKVKELMLVLQIEVNRRYNPNSYPQASQLRKSQRIQGEQTRLYPPTRHSASSRPSGIATCFIILPQTVAPAAFVLSRREFSGGQHGRNSPT
jgi:hypothetical protein